MHEHDPLPPNASPTAPTLVADLPPPTLFFLHYLGGSARSWDAVTARLGDHYRCVAVDLPGFGDAAAATGDSVSELVEAVAQAVRAEGPARWALVGHSMGAKVAAVLARRAEDGEAGLAGLSHMMLFAGSPPSPEPMDQDRRRTMLGWFAGSPDASQGEAREFVRQNLGGPLPPRVTDQAVEDVLRARRSAWAAWLDAGSREDWADRVGVLRTPALLVAGGSDGDLGAAAQAELMARHFASSRLVTLPGAGHLLPLERAEEVARLIVEHMSMSDQAPTAIPGLSRDYAALIDSDRVSARTRAILRERGRPPAVESDPTVLADRLMDVLRAAADRVIPQPSGSRIDLAAAIAADLAGGRGDGWRFALLPPDAQAYRAALATLDAAAEAAQGVSFARLDGAAQDGLLDRVARSDLHVPGDEGLLSAEQMRLWFDDLRADATRAYVAHPATLDRLGYSGVANGGDGPRKQGFVRLAAGEREAWEPTIKTGRPS